MSETPTPETESVTRSADETPWTPWVCAGHAKRLERERDEARRELDLVSDKLCKSESAYLKNEEIIDGLKNEIEHTETFFRDKLSRAADDVNEAKRERDEARREINILKRAAIEVLKVVPVAHCSEMYHGKRDMHLLGPCPVVERYNARIEKLRAKLKEEA